MYVCVGLSVLFIVYKCVFFAFKFVCMYRFCVSLCKILYANEFVCSCVCICVIEKRPIEMPDWDVRHFVYGESRLIR